VPCPGTDRSHRTCTCLAGRVPAAGRASLLRYRAGLAPPLVSHCCPHLVLQQTAAQLEDAPGTPARFLSPQPADASPPTPTAEKEKAVAARPEASEQGVAGLPVAVGTRDGQCGLSSPAAYDRASVRVRLSAPDYSLNTFLKKYYVLVIQDSHLYTHFSRTHIYSISYSISTTISYPLSSLSFSLLLSFYRRAHRNAIFNADSHSVGWCGVWYAIFSVPSPLSCCGAVSLRSLSPFGRRSRLSKRGGGRRHGRVDGRCRSINLDPAIPVPPPTNFDRRSSSFNRARAAMARTRTEMFCPDLALRRSSVTVSKLTSREYRPSSKENACCSLDGTAPLPQFVPRRAMAGTLVTRRFPGIQAIYLESLTVLGVCVCFFFFLKVPQRRAHVIHFWKVAGLFEPLG
jgi:hypothetical protein